MLHELWTAFVSDPWNDGLFGKLAAVCSIVLFVITPVLTIYNTYFIN